MRHWLLIALSLAPVFNSANAVADPAATAEARILATLQQRFPDSAIEAVHASIVPGWYEVITPSELVYTDAQVDVLFVGKLIDTRTKEDLSAKRLSQLHGIDFKILPLDRAVKVVKGNGRRTVAVFEDPNCPYCRQLEQNIKDITDVTIYTFLYPLEELHPGAATRARAIWCAADRAAAWAKWMQENIEPAKTECDGDPIASLQSLGKQLRIDGTPTTFFADGHRVEGVITREAIERQLDGSAVVTKR